MFYKLRVRIAALGVLAVFAVVFVFSGVGIATAQTPSAPTHGAGPYTFQLTGNNATGTAVGALTNNVAQDVTFQGTMTVDKFVSSGRNVWAVGTLTGNVVNSSGTVLKSVQNLAVTVPVQRIDPSCPILDLTLGPLHLNLLGLVVDLNQIHLTITAQSGSGNLLGNLLCSVAHLLDGSASGNAIANLLNNILSILNGL